MYEYVSKYRDVKITQSRTNANMSHEVSDYFLFVQPICTPLIIRPVLMFHKINTYRYIYLSESSKKYRFSASRTTNGERFGSRDEY